MVQTNPAWFLRSTVRQCKDNFSTVRGESIRTIFKIKHALNKKRLQFMAVCSMEDIRSGSRTLVHTKDFFGAYWDPYTICNSH